MQDDDLNQEFFLEDLAVTIIRILPLALLDHVSITSRICIRRLETLSRALCTSVTLIALQKNESIGNNQE
jgi:hypothetical protein